LSAPRAEGGRLGVIAGSSLRGSDVVARGFEYVQRHAGEGEGYVLPHLLDHAANLGRLRDAGCDRVLAIASVGSLRAELHPGILVCPDDFIAIDAGPVTALEGTDAHRVPGFDPAWRERVRDAVRAAGKEVVDGGVYRQVAGPRFETQAEVRMLARDAHVVGMTLGSECVVAGELDLAYAAICVVDNFANGVAETTLTSDEVLAAQAAHREGVQHLLEIVAPSLA
jgi:5'-methylthioadenosine phosphorylase